ncbi:class I SAM-dependent DNA methyltransferase [Propionibacteriaceae bacterium Y2011]
MREPDRAFADPRLALLYDDLESDRSDLSAYVALAAELEARTVIDIGCGTGSLAVLLAAQGLDVVGVDPTLASLEVARRKPHADQVNWIAGDATSLLGRGLQSDLAVMTGNVAQVFVTDDDWNATLAAVRASLRPGGWFVFETRRPDARAWEGWGWTDQDVALPDGRTARLSMTVTEVALPLVSFEAVTVVAGQELPSSSTLRFRERTEVEDDLARHGFQVMEVRDAPDRPGQEHVFLARRTASEEAQQAGPPK